MEVTEYTRKKIIDYLIPTLKKNNADPKIIKWYEDKYVNGINPGEYPQGCKIKREKSLYENVSTEFEGDN